MIFKQANHNSENISLHSTPKEGHRRLKLTHLAQSLIPEIYPTILQPFSDAVNEEESFLQTKEKK